MKAKVMNPSQYEDERHIRKKPGKCQAIEGILHKYITP
jgi:hypothetical protein